MRHLFLPVVCISCYFNLLVVRFVLNPECRLNLKQMKFMHKLPS
ncbi:unnamed protein product [Prunus brigantina]